MRLVLRQETDKYEIGEKIRDARKAQGMSQDDLAELIGSDPQTISRHESGSREMAIGTLFQYVEALCDKPEDFFPERFEHRETAQAEKIYRIAKTLDEEDLGILLAMAERMSRGGK